MADLIYPNGAGITVVSETELEADDMTFVGCSLTGTPQQTDYTNLKSAVMSNPESIGWVTPATEVNTNQIYVTDAGGNGGYYYLASKTANSGTLTGTSDKIEVNVPSGSKVVGCSLRVDTAVTDDGGDDTWSAAYSGGLTQAIVSGAAAAKNTKVNTFFDVNAATDIATSEVDITLTPNGGSFTAGQITAVIYYYGLTSLSSV